MTIPLEFIGLPGPHRDMAKFVNAVRERTPGITNSALQDVVHAAGVKLPPRYKRQAWVHWGADILSDDLTSIDAWPYLDPARRNEVARLPREGGVTVTAGDPKASTLMRDALVKGTLNRRSLMMPAGLSKTYIWCAANNWMQEVSDADAAILRSAPFARLLFRNPNYASGPVEVQSLTRPVVERFALTSLEDAQALERDHTRRPQWKGVEASR